MTDACRTGGDAYADGGDGYDGKCPGCADATDAIATSIDCLKAWEDVLRDTGASQFPGGENQKLVSCTLSIVALPFTGDQMVDITLSDPHGVILPERNDPAFEKARVLFARTDAALSDIVRTIPADGLPLKVTCLLQLKTHGADIIGRTITSNGITAPAGRDELAFLATRLRAAGTLAPEKIAPDLTLLMQDLTA